MKITITVPSDKYALVEPILKGLQGLIGKGCKIQTESNKITDTPVKISRRKDIFQQAKANMLSGKCKKIRA